MAEWAMTSSLPSYRGYRVPAAINSHAVWPYHRFGLSVRDVEDFLFARTSRTTRPVSVTARCIASSRPPITNASRRSMALCRISSGWADTNCELSTTGRRNPSVRRGACGDGRLLTERWRSAPSERTAPFSPT